MNRRDKQKAETFIEIMRTAEALFMEQGYERTSMQQIAERAGMTKGALYHHFRSKDAIIDRICGEHYRVLSEAARPWAEDRSLPCFERMRKVISLSRNMGMASFSFASEYLRRTYDAESFKLKERLRRYDREYYTAFMAPLLGEAKEKGECSFISSPDVLAFFMHQLALGVSEEISRVFMEEMQDNQERMIVEIMKAYIEILARMLNGTAERISDLIDFEEAMFFYSEILRKKHGFP
jgi:AcrR family transcriptional regulator